MEEFIAEIVTRCDSLEVLQHIAAVLVEERLAACAHVRGPVQSTYRWNGVVTQASEWELDAITTLEGATALRARISSLHPYDTPALISRDCSASRKYADWVRTETQQ
jgi:periplasmic divalent cation tolerance protein